MNWLGLGARLSFGLIGASELNLNLPPKHSLVSAKANPSILSLLPLKLHGSKHIFIGNSVVLHLHGGPELRTDRLEQ